MSAEDQMTIDERRQYLRRMQERYQQANRRELGDALRLIAESMDYVCPERLASNLVCMAYHLAAPGKLRLSPGLLQQLDRIGVSTVERILTRIHQDELRLPRQGP